MKFKSKWTVHSFVSALVQDMVRQKKNWTTSDVKTLWHQKESKFSFSFSTNRKTMDKNAWDQCASEGAQPGHDDSSSALDGDQESLQILVTMVHSILPSESTQVYEQPFKGQCWQTLAFHQNTISPRKKPLQSTRCVQENKAPKTVLKKSLRHKFQVAFCFKMGILDAARHRRFPEGRFAAAVAHEVNL